MKIGILQTGLVPDSLSARWGQYSDMFGALLTSRGFDTEAWSVVENEFPPGPEAADGWLITGSRHGAYEDHAWIPPLEELIRDIHASDRPLVGVCFGHQIIAQALGGTVEKYPGGWAVGAHTYEFGDGPKTINAWHQDQVVARPEGAQLVATNPFCENAALLYGDSIYTVQAHPEFDDAFTQALIDERGPGIVPDALLEGARAKLGAPSDRLSVIDQFERFFRTRRLT
ncbi:type 1 glutamine amidotransferase [Roseivivax sediminis]|uniref:GMP synthase-Glutamine amidotransferase n=1 Tax=Roseivivax sediminis TaxID=936889 RepID=A0A1I2BHK2_9RHOB|nr:type 1 glutamine amidotransferase [Roseivivax sediminis]SFE55655.1 GMP synthase-Glutamine amidotransferase [Roseivivax sediminis]